jgi:hypothetical protein
MLSRCSHVRMEARRCALDEIAARQRAAEEKREAEANPQYAAEPSYMKHRTEGHTETTISGDTRADWPEAFELVPSLERRVATPSANDGKPQQQRMPMPQPRNQVCFKVEI